MSFTGYEPPKLDQVPIFTRTDFCFVCLEYGDNKRLRTHHIQSEALRYTLQEGQLTLCYLCNKRALQAESFLHNLNFNQKLWKGNNIVPGPILHTAKNLVKPIVDFVYSRTNCLDINCVKEMKSDLNLALKNGSSKVPLNRNIAVKTERRSLEDDIVSSLCINTPASTSDGSIGGGEQQLGKDFDVDRHLEAFQLAMARRKTKVKSERVKTVPDKVYRTRPARKRRGKEKIEMLHISRSQCFEERNAALQDKKYTTAPFKCESCVKGFAFKSAYENHMEKHLDINGEYECDICGQRVDTEEKMHLHKKYHFVRYKCGVCGLVRICRSTIVDHYVAMHSDTSQPLVCPHCPKTFKRLVSRKKHIMYHHRERTRVCCKFCSKSYSNKEVLKNHYVTVHPTEVSEMPPRKPYICEDCGKAFSAPSQLKKHQIKHTDKKDFYCVECDKCFKSESILKHHLKTAAPHVNYMELPFPCVHCDKRFSVRRDLEFHMNGIHLKIKPYACDKCDRAYSSKCSLQKHKQFAHYGKQPTKYPCPMCDKQFDNRVLKNHIRTHTGEKPFACIQCPMKFSQSSSLATHIKLIHLRLTRDGKKKPERF